MQKQLVYIWWNIRIYIPENIRVDLVYELPVLETLLSDFLLLGVQDPVGIMKKDSIKS